MRYFVFLFFLLYNFTYAQQANFPLKENLGQWENHIDYKVDFSDLSIFIEKDGTWTFVLVDEEKYVEFHDTRAAETDYSRYIMDYFAYKIHFIDADFSHKVQGNSSPFYSNYFIGNDPSKYAKHVRSYESVLYKNIWENIDLLVYTNEKHQFKYDFILHKDANINDIQLQYEGPECLTLDRGELIINGSFSLLKEQLPITYFQESNKEISCKYKLNNNIISFDLDINKIEETIVIDPILVGATASGSTGSNFGHTAGYDVDGNIYTGAICFATGYPTNTGSYQQNFPNSTCSAINKLNPTGSSLLYSTYLGGTTGVGYPVSLACTESKKLVVLGATLSNDFPTTSSAFQPSHGGLNDITVSILSEDGSTLLGSTYLGGSGNDGRITAGGSLLDLSGHDNFKGTVKISDGKILCVGSVSSDDINGLTYPNPNTISATNSDAIVFKMDTTLSTLIAHAFVGGSQAERGYGLTTDQDENVYICGATLSQDLYTTSGVYQENTLANTNEVAGFITKLTPDLNTTLASSYISTEFNPLTSFSSGTAAYFVSLDYSGHPYLYGIDRSTELPQIGSGYQFGDGRVYIAKLNPELSSLLSTNKMGANTNVELGAFKVDDCDRILFSCYGNTSFEITPDNIFQTGGMYVGILSPGGQDLTFGTYYTGNHVDGGTSQFSDNGSIYHAVCVNSNTFHCHTNAYSQNIISDFDCKVFKIDPELGTLDIKILQPVVEFCTGQSHIYETNTIGALSSIEWYLDGQLVSNNETYEATFMEEGTYVLKVTGVSECIHPSEDSIVINVTTMNPEFESDTVHCIGGTINYTDLSIIPPQYATHVTDWLWEFGDGNTSTLEHPTHNYSDTGWYDVSLTLTTASGCIFNITQELQVEIFDVSIDFEADSLVCEKDEVNFNPTVQIPEHIEAQPVSYYWEFGDGQTSYEKNPKHIYDQVGLFDVTLQVTLDNGCEYSITHPSIVETYEITLDMALLTDSLWYPFNTPIEAYVTGLYYDSVEWIVDDQVIETGDSLTIYAETDQAVEYITITAHATASNCEATVTKTVKLTNYEYIDIPNAFTPNGDGINDIFIPLGRQVDNADYYEFKIHNRWGEQVFYTNDKEEGWNGLNKRGDKVSAAMYVWHLELQTKISGHQSYNGWVKLIK